MTIQPKVDTAAWAEDNFGNCCLGDKRRSARLVKLAEQAADRPGATLPKIGESWGDTKGIYRLLDRPESTLQSTTATHRAQVCNKSGKSLILCDTTHVDLGWQRDLPDAGPIGAGRGQGFLLHSGLLVDTEDESLVGLAGQVAHIRSKKRKGRQSASQRLKRWRESEMWIELMEQIGPPPEGAEHIHVCDSGADNFEVFATAKCLGCDFLIRAGRRHRKVLVEGRKKPLSQAISAADELGEYDLEISRGNERKARTASLKISAKAIEIPLPRHRSRRIKKYAREHGDTIPAWAISVEETDAPAGTEPVSWLLLTTVPVENFEDAWEVIGWYENRWLIEEWHKALKTGCRLEKRQLQTVERLLPLAGVLSVVAVLLVQLKHLARTRPNQPAREIVPKLWLKLLQAKRKTKTWDITNYEFWRAVAKLGGFLGRRHDGEPGWQLIWRGWQELYLLAEGARLARKCG